MRKITESEARKILKEDDADYLPFAILNAMGKVTVKDWVRINSKDENKVYGWYYGSWFLDVENAMQNASDGESIIIEMSGRLSMSGNPETLTIPKDCFDWILNDGC